jgi:hypothetical protein
MMIDNQYFVGADGESCPLSNLFGRMHRMRGGVGGFHHHELRAAGGHVQRRSVMISDIHRLVLIHDHQTDTCVGCHPRNV